MDMHPQTSAASSHISDEHRAIDWTAWLARWDAQQTGYLPDREARFTAMFDALAQLLPSEFVVLDLCSGPGSLSQRLLARFPGARVVAVDYDPVLLKMGRAVLGDYGGRLRWVEADLREPAWIDTLGEARLDAVLSTTALHWLNGSDLCRVFHQLARLIPSGGLLLNGDNMPYAANSPRFQKVAEAIRTARWNDARFAELGVENWKQWWDALRAEPGMESLVEERDRRFPPEWRAVWHNTTYDLQAAALLEAGFTEVGTIWQHFDNRVLMAVR